MSLTTNGIGFARRAADFVGGGPRPDQHLARFAGPGDLPAADPAAPADRCDRRAGRGGRRRAGPGQDQHRADARRQRPRGAGSAAVQRASAATSCDSSNRCRWTPGIPGPGNEWSPPTRSRQRCPRGSRSPRIRGARLGAPAELFVVDGGPATVGIIASVTRPFCGDCDRTRLTADGQVRTCLFSRNETDLRALLRGGGSDEDIAARLAGRDLGQAAGARHQRPVVPAARSADERHRWLTRSCGPAPAGLLVTVTVRYFAAARAAAGVPRSAHPDGSADLPSRRRRRTIRRVTVATVLAAAVDRHGPGWPACCSAAATCWTRSRCTARRPWFGDGQVLDVLPPFAGG